MILGKIHLAQLDFLPMMPPFTRRYSPRLARNCILLCKSRHDQQTQNIIHSELVTLTMTLLCTIARDTNQKVNCKPNPTVHSFMSQATSGETGYMLVQRNLIMYANVTLPFTLVPNKVDRPFSTMLFERDEICNMFQMLTTDVAHPKVLLRRKFL